MHLLRAATRLMPTHRVVGGPTAARHTQMHMHTVAPAGSSSSPSAEAASVWPQRGPSSGPAPHQHRWPCGARGGQRSKHARQRLPWRYSQQRSLGDTGGGSGSGKSSLTGLCPEMLQTKVVGVTHHALVDDAFREQLRAGDFVSVLAEPTNAFDTDALMVVTHGWCRV